MRPRLYLHAIQSVTISREKVVFTTRHGNGCCYYFILPKNQFLNFDDILTLTNSQNHISGHFPLGKNFWLHYAEKVTLYIASKDNRPYFTFQCFSEYKKFTHERILLLLRLSDAAVGRQRVKRIGGRGGSRPVSSNHQRSLPSVVQTVHQSPRAKRVRGEWESVPRAADDVVMSNPEEEGAVLPERKNTNSRWRIESSSTTTSEDGDPLPHEYVLSDSDSINVVEGQ